jgi:two-component system nitrogen regulation sensor histidine kinase NtrY
MVFKNFRLNVVLRVIVLSFSVAFVIWLLTATSLYLTASLFAFFVVIQVVLLIRFVEKTNELVTRFFRSARHGDFPSASSLGGQGRSFDDLHAAFTELMDDLRQARARTEERDQSLQTVIQHIGFGLISFRRDGGVGLMNTAAKRILHTHQLANIKSLTSFSPELVRTFFRLHAGDRVLVKVDREAEALQLAVHATEYRVAEQPYTLVSIQNIGSELEEKEMEAWHNLIRVLTHEIMNSITPISSLASTVNAMLSATPVEGERELSKETLVDISGAVQTIERRSRGLLHFVDAYRNLTRIPKPALTLVTISELFSRVHGLMQSQIAEDRIAYTSRIEPEGLELTADPDLIEQVLINLIRNAMQSMSGQPERKLELSARVESTGRLRIEVWDNGPGIPGEIQSRIFIPFFTTKAEGSGIGLSLSRQIMRMHGGTITCRSGEGTGTTFALKF